MSQSVITLAFETYKAQQELVAQPVVLDEFVLANVPNLDPTLPIDRNEALPNPDHIVHIESVSQQGFINPNAVVYSLIMDSSVGDFEFNWLGLRNKASGVLAAISHFPLTTKEKTVGGVSGNSITRSVMMGYSGAKEATGIDIDASTWQIDFTARLQGIDERVRQENIDQYGNASFITTGFELYQEGDDYYVRGGVGYVGGLRCYLDEPQSVDAANKPTFIYLDASWQGQLTSEWSVVQQIVVTSEARSDYVDSEGVKHYVTKIAEVLADGSFIDWRLLAGAPAFERKDNAATDEEIDAKSTETKHIKLPQLWRVFDTQHIKDKLVNNLWEPLVEKMWLSLSDRIYPVGAPIPWFSDTLPDSDKYAFMLNQAFDMEANPKLAIVYPDGIIPTMEGLGLVGKESDESVGAYEEGQVKEHGHPGSAVSSTNLGSKTTNTTGNHYHRYTEMYHSGAVAGGGGTYNKSTRTSNTTSAGNHYHSVSIGSHAHTVAIALFGALKNTINHRKCNFIVRMA